MEERDEEMQHCWLWRWAKGLLEGRKGKKQIFLEFLEGTEFC